MLNADNRRRMSLGDYLDKLLISAIGVIFLWFGFQMQDITKKIQTLSENMASFTAELRNSKEETNRIRCELSEHISHDRERYEALVIASKVRFQR